MKIRLIQLILFLPLFAFSQGYWQQEVDYVMDIDFNVNTHQFTGKTKLIYKNNSPDTLHKVFLHLYFNAFQPNSMMDVRSRTISDPDTRVKDRIFQLKPNEIGYLRINSFDQNGKKTNYITEETVLEVTLSEAILPGTTTQFDFTYQGQVPVQIRRSGRYNEEGIAYSMAQWFPKMAEYDRKGWHAHPYVGREFYSPWGKYEVNITIDKTFVVAASGILQNADEVKNAQANAKKSKAKTITWRFKADQVHDFMWAADPDYQVTSFQVPNGPLLQFYYQPGKETAAWSELAPLLSESFVFMSSRFGKYPYPVFNVIQGGDGGMEYPMSTLITGHRSLPSLLGVSIHEAMHSWYQGVLAFNESYDEWMDEGFTSYGTSLTLSYLSNGDDSNRSQTGNYRGYFGLAASGLEEPLSTHADQYETNFAYGRAAYSKGAVTMSQLSYIIGEENLQKGLLRFFDEWKFKHPDRYDFLRVMEKVSGLELDWYYDYWVNTTKQIDYAVDSVFAKGDKTIIRLKRVGKMPMPIDLVVTTENGSETMHYIPLGVMRGEKPQESAMPRLIQRDWYWTHPTYEIEVDLPYSNVQKVEIDPSGRMADVNKSNNLFQKK